MMMVMRLWLVLVCVVVSFAVSAQMLRGTVTDVDGNAIPYAAVYLDELHRGISTDADGRFQLELPTGNYCCRVTSLGYKSLETQVDVAGEETECHFTLEMRPIALDEVQVVADGSEDPAYGIMRHVIARAPYYECRPDSFAAKVYVKGSGKITDTPGVFNLSADFRKEKDNVVNRLFVLEKVSNVEFGAPNSWVEHVEAESNTFPSEVSAEIPTMIANFYAKELFGSPSPLREGAFTYYKYKLDDHYEENGRSISKISVMPRRDAKGLFRGCIYVIDGEWCLAAADLEVSAALYDAHLVANFQEVSPSLFLPVSQALRCRIGVLGIGVTASYTTSVQYSHIESQPRGEIVGLSERGNRLMDEIGEVEQKGELSKSDAYRLAALTAQLMEENLATQGKIKRRSKYDLTYRLGSRSITTDSAAARRDSAYWAGVRSVPLDDEELESYRRHRGDTAATTAAEDEDISDIIGDALFTGNSALLENDKAWIRLGGLTSIISGFNFVDGYKVGLGFSAGYDFSNALSIRVKPSAYYNTARKRVTGQVEATLSYALLRRGRLSVSGGRVSADYNGESPEASGIVAIQTALFGRNDVKLYDRAFVSVKNDIEIANGTRFAIGGTWERRRPLDNHVAHSWFKKDASPNVPRNEMFAALPAVNDALTATATISYTPAAYYYVIDGRKRYLRSRFPTFELTYVRGFGFNDAAPAYNRLDLSIEQEVELGIFNKIIYQVRGGMFFGASRLQFPDFKHFSATRFPLTARRFTDSFVLLDNYAYSTDSRYAEAGVTWQSPRMILKQLPFLRDKNFSECLHLRSAVTHHRRPYSELGYSVNIFDMASVGVFTSWHGIDYHTTCVSISLPLGR